MDPSLHVITCHYLAALDHTVWPYVEMPLQHHKTGLLVGVLFIWSFYMFRYVVMGGAADFKVGVQNKIRERSERKKIVYPTFPNVGIQASKYQ